MFNRDFIGRTINGERTEYDPNKKDVLKYTSQTDDFYIDLVQGVYQAVGGKLDQKNKHNDNMLARLADNSPAKVQHLVEGYAPAAAGTLAATATLIEKAFTGEDVYASEIPFIRRFYSSYRLDRVGATEYWLLEHRIKNANAQARDLSKNRTDYKQFTSAPSYKKMKEAERAIKRMNKNKLTKEDVNKLIKFNNEINEAWDKE